MKMKVSGLSDNKNELTRENARENVRTKNAMQ